MSLEITFRVNGLEHSDRIQDHPSERLVKFLQELDGILEVHYDPNTCRFAVRYNPNRITIFRILSRIELAGRRIGFDYRPADVRTRQGDSGLPPGERIAQPVLSEHS
jgi:hypothetical protein